MKQSVPQQHPAKNNIYYRSLGKDNGRGRETSFVNREPPCYLRLQSNLGWLTAAPSLPSVIINHSTRSSLPHQLKCSTCESNTRYKGSARKIVLRTKKRRKREYLRWIYRFYVSMLIKINTRRID